MLVRSLRSTGLHPLSPDRNDRGFVLVEAIVAMIAVSGVLLLTLDISDRISKRTLLAKLEVKAAAFAEALLARAEAEYPLRESQIAGMESDGTSWVLRIQEVERRTVSPHTMQLTADVSVSVPPITVSLSVATLQLRWNSQK